MKTKQSILALILSFFVSFSVLGQNEISTELIDLHKAILAHHIRPDSSFTEDRALFVINKTIEFIDPGGYLFIQSDLDELRKMTKEVASIDNNAPFLYYNKLIAIFQSGIERNTSIRNKLENEDWSFSEDYSIQQEDTIFATSEEELYTKWKNRLMLDYAYNRYYELDSIEWQTALQDENISDSIFNGLIEEYACVFDYLSENETVLKSGVKDVLFNAYTLSYDPHSSYYTAERKKRFKRALSISNYQFGFQLVKNSTGQFEISQLEPGGPAWNSNKIHEGDIVISLLLNGKKVNMSCRDGSDIVQRLTGSNSEQLKIQVKKQSGIIEKHTLYSEVVENVDNHINGYLLDGSVKVGYIGLPAFYTNWDNSNSTGCANDVGKELMKLKQENIQGLILDLRDNGGGSLYEALALSGAFVSEGSLCIKTEANRKPRLQKDPNRGKLYSGPLIVLVNEFSASASEVTAGILQDFNRAVIVGNQTFGKATGQQLIPVNSIYNANQRRLIATSENTGFLKLTNLELHNLKGESHQGRGIQPDIILPSQYDHVKEKELDYPYWIQVNPIVKKTYYTPEADLPLNDLKTASKSRLDSDSLYLSIMENNTSFYAKLKVDKPIPLKASALKKYIEEEQTNSSKSSYIPFKHDYYKAKSPTYDERIYSMNTTKNELNEETIKWLNTDPEMVEAYRIMNDLIKLKNK